MRLALLLTLLPITATAQQCFPREVAERVLRENFNMNLVARGLRDSATVLEIYTGENGHFVATHRTAQGVICVVDGGQNFFLIETPAAAMGEDG